MIKSGYADLPLHYGKVPAWLYDRMALLGEAILESVILEYGRKEVLRRLSDPFWFQSLGCVMGMDWHSSGITTSVMGALKKASKRLGQEYGIYICGGRGKHSLQTPNEIIAISERTGINGNNLVLASRLSAKIDNTAIQDGFQLYLHSFILTIDGEWGVVQQGMNQTSRLARRYHWHSSAFSSFVEEPHTSICGKNQGIILNLTDKKASPARSEIVSLTKDNRAIDEAKKLIMPLHHDVRQENVDSKKLGAILALAAQNEVEDFESLLLLRGIGPRAIQSLAMVSEIIYGSPSRFQDPARFSFAHGGKDGHPFPVPTKIYDQTISLLRNAVEKSKLGMQEKSTAIKNLHKMASDMERDFFPNDHLDDLIQQERENPHLYGGRTVFGKAKKPGKVPSISKQLSLFDDFKSHKDH
jgi:uncharacterized protein